MGVIQAQSLFSNACQQWVHPSFTIFHACSSLLRGAGGTPVGTAESTPQDRHTMFRSGRVQRIWHGLDIAISPLGRALVQLARAPSTRLGDLYRKHHHPPHTHTWGWKVIT